LTRLVFCNVDLSVLM